MPQKISALPVKAKVRDAKTKYYGIPIGWEIGDKNHAGYPANSTTLVAESIIKICCFDAMESDGILDRERYGNNRYSLANIRQWLNKSGTGWYQAQHSYDRPPSNSYVWNGHNAYDAQSGFLTGFGAEMLAALLTTTLTVAKPGTDGGGSETVQDKIFLLSMAEVGLGSENGVAEGTKLAMFSDNASRQCKPTAQAVSNSEYTNSSLSASQFWYWWLRSPASSDASLVRCVDSDGSLYDHYACSGLWGVRPALTLKSDILASILDAEDKKRAAEIRPADGPQPGVDETPEQAEMALYEQAVEQFGESAQILMAVEEMSELQKALLKYLRFKDHEQGDEAEILAAISEERADVEIMLNQLHVIFGDNTDMEIAKLEHLCELLGE